MSVVGWPTRQYLMNAEATMFRPVEFALKIVLRYDKMKRLLSTTAMSSSAGNIIHCFCSLRYRLVPHNSLQFTIRKTRIKDNGYTGPNDIYSRLQAYWGEVYVLEFINGDHGVYEKRIQRNMHRTALSG